MNRTIGDLRPAEILLAEDNEDDVEITRRGFAKSKLTVNLHHVENGEQCLAYLRKEPPYENTVTPDLLLLDLNMPRLNGREVLSQLVQDDRLRHLPVVVLTTSKDEQEVLDAYRMRCSAYATKPVDFHQFVSVVQNIGEFYFTVVVLPANGDADRNAARIGEAIA
ncbi:MAG: response regulator [Planctomycetales bacterium]|nr:response regulator [Planctomycetales bacterium]